MRTPSSSDRHGLATSRRRCREGRTLGRRSGERHAQRVHGGPRERGKGCGHRYGTRRSPQTGSPTESADRRGVGLRHERETADREERVHGGRSYENQATVGPCRSCDQSNNAVWIQVDFRSHGPMDPWTHGPPAVERIRVCDSTRSYVSAGKREIHRLIGWPHVAIERGGSMGPWVPWDQTFESATLSNKPRRRAATSPATTS